ncbi:MAG: hypothetical protein ABI851_04240 [Saprospiraceae bacterium]
MKNLLLIIVILFQMDFCLIAQEFPIIVVSTKGKVQYSSSTQQNNVIASGAVLESDGKVTLSTGAAVLIYYNAEFISLKIGTNTLKSICNSKTQRKNLNVDGKFGEGLVKAIDLANLAGDRDENWSRINNFKNLKSDGFGEKGVKDGFGEKGVKDGFGDKGVKDGFGDKGVKDGFGDKGVKDGFGEKGVKDGFGEKGVKDGFGDKGVKDGFGEKGVKDGFGEKGVKDGFGEKGVKDGFGEKGVKDGFGEKGVKDGFGEKGVKDGFGEKGVKDGFGEKGVKDGFGEKGVKDGFGDKGVKDGFGDKGVKDGFGEKGVKDGFGDKGVKDGFGDKGVKDGWAGNGTHITLILPALIIEPKLTSFNWSKPGNTSTYKLEVLDMNDKIVYSTIAKDTFVSIDINKIKLKINEDYSWKVSSIQNPEIMSSSNPISIHKMEVANSPDTKLLKSKIYKNADPVTKLLMKAILFENDQWFYNAQQMYSQAKKLDTKNKLVKMMHAAFWYRGDIYELADAAVAQ